MWGFICLIKLEAQSISLCKVTVALCGGMVERRDHTHTHTHCRKFPYTTKLALSLLYQVSCVCFHYHSSKDVPAMLRTQQVYDFSSRLNCFLKFVGKFQELALFLL
jgi:hypothetical protein